MARKDKPQLYLGDLNGPAGNAFAILGSARKVALEVGSNRLDATWEEIEAEAKSSDYDHLLETINKYFEVL